MTEPSEELPPLWQRFTRSEGAFHLTGLEALVRLSLDQVRRDRQAGLRMGAFYSGYPGSPLAGLDKKLQSLAPLLEPRHVRFVPGLNEEIAAGAVCGTQMIDLFPHASYDGVLGLWFGKAPGLDRALDVIRHSSFIGISRFGGAIALVGDDPMCKSSSLPSHSETALAHAYVPTFYPADAAEVLDLGRHAFALSRYVGCWTALKIVPEVADGGMIVERRPERPVELPSLHDTPFAKRLETWLLAPRVNQVESEVIFERLELARRYAHHNGLNPVVARGDRDRLGLVASGRLYRELRSALERIAGPGNEALTRLGLRLLKIDLLYPLDPGRLLEFARGLETVVVVDERRGFLEDQVRAVLCDAPRPPRVLGRYTEEGRPWLSRHHDMSEAALSRDLAPWLAGRLGRPELAGRAAPLDAPPPALSLRRRPHFCSGCPHTRSTRVPGDSLAGGGIGCHTMALFENRSIQFFGAMGSEGSQWIGLSGYVDTPHLFQNLGDGTFFHSGRLAFRACAQAGVNMTFRLLYNGVIAMTGGQVPVGMKPIAELARDLLQDGAQRIVAVSRDPGLQALAASDARVELIERDAYEAAHARLREEPGVTVLLYDQVCSNEKARLEKRGVLPRNAERPLIHRDVCEGCGDCGARSNCLSLWPVATPLGRKTELHRTSCTDDRSCLDGECPAFLTAELPAPEALHPPLELDSLPPAPIATIEDDRYEILMVGVGSTGVVTLDAILMRAAELEGLHALHLDQTGLAQRGGRVTSHCILSRTPVCGSPRVQHRRADVCFALDPLSANDPDSLERMAADRTHTLIHLTLAPTGEQILDADLATPGLDELSRPLAARSRSVFEMRADALSELLLGSTLGANVALLGAALQQGRLPVSVEAIETTIRQSGIAVEENLIALRLGRAIAHDPSLAEKLLADSQPPGIGDGGSPAQARLLLGGAFEELERSLSPGAPARERTRCLERVAAFAIDLAEYQAPAYAARYLATLRPLAEAERRADPRSLLLVEVAARELYRFHAYKDEYEVARLLLHGPYRRWLERRHGPGVQVRYHLEPPLLRHLGLRRKIALGRGAELALRGLVHLRRLRGTRLDPFGWLPSRRLERELVGWYARVLERLAAALTPANLDRAVEIADASSRIRGFEGVKQARAREVRARVEEQLSAL